MLTDLGKIQNEKKTQIDTAINTYIGNYCYRKCFNHDNILIDCFNKFEELKGNIGHMQITFKELNDMIKSEEIRICKLPLNDKKRYVLWRYFEHLKDNDTDFWDLKDKENGTD